MKNRKHFTLFALVLCLVLLTSCLYGCNRNKVDKPDNESTPLVLQSAELDGVFNPFFSSSAYDLRVIDKVVSYLLVSDKKGIPVAGDEYASIAKSIDIVKNEDGTANYNFVLKNGLKFSDGTPVTADDVLFNMYVYLDPKYDGSTTMYTLPIVGLSNYRTQIPGYDDFAPVAQAILAQGEVFAESDIYTQDQFNTYWAEMDKQGKVFAQEIVDLVNSEYGADKFVKNYFCDELDYVTIKASEGLKIAYGMGMWGFGDIFYDYSVDNENGKIGFVIDDKGEYKLKGDKMDCFTADLTGDSYKLVKLAKDDDGALLKNADGKYYYFNADKEEVAYENELYVAVNDKTKLVGGGTGTVYIMADLTIADYWTELKAGYENDEGVVNFTLLGETETAGLPLIATVEEEFVKAFSEVGVVPNVSGITKGTKNIDGIDYETISVVTKTQSPTTIYQLGVQVVPKAYYTSGYTYSNAEGAIENYGCQFNSVEFMKHLKTKNSKPIGSGPYKFIDFKDNIVTFERNTEFECFGFGNAKIKYLRIKVVSSGQEFSAVKTGDVHFANVSATSDVVNEVSTIKKLKPIFVDYLGYGYICINPMYYKTLEERIALTTTFNLDLIKEYYPSGLAEVIYRCMSKVNWAYPEDATAKYPYDATGETAKQKFLEAGYTYNGDTLMKDGKQAEFVFTLPSDASDHPAGRIFLNAKDVLEGIGANVKIDSDSNLIANIKKPEGVGVYALAWQATADPDMYQVYHYNSQAESVKSNGIKWLYENGDEDQKNLIKSLGDKIVKGTQTMDIADRKPIYNDALNILAELSIEIPTYQRKDLFVYNCDIIDSESLSAEVTPYWEPMQEIWKVSFKA